MYYGESNNDLAKANFEKAIKIDQNYSNARYFLGLIYAKEGDKEKEVYIIEPSITDKKLQEYALENVVRNLLNLTVEDYKFNADVSQKEKKASIKLILTDNETMQMDIYPADKEDIAEYIVDVGFNDYFYLVKEAEIKKFIKTKAELVE